MISVIYCGAVATHSRASVQIIDTSIVRVHQHGACIIRNRKQSMGRSRGGLTSKIHAVVDTNGLLMRLALTAGKAHDNRLADKLLFSAKRRIQIGGPRLRVRVPRATRRADPGRRAPHAHRPKSIRAGERVVAGAVTPLGRDQFAQPRKARDANRVSLPIAKEIGRIASVGLRWSSAIRASISDQSDHSMALSVTALL